MALLTPKDIREHNFNIVRLKSGYDIDEVDDFLDEVTETVEALGRQAIQGGTGQDAERAERAASSSGRAAEFPDRSADRPGRQRQQRPDPDEPAQCGSEGTRRGPSTVPEPVQRAQQGQVRAECSTAERECRTSAGGPGTAGRAGAALQDRAAQQAAGRVQEARGTAARAGLQGRAFDRDRQPSQDCRRRCRGRKRGRPCDRHAHPGHAAARSVCR